MQNDEHFITRNDSESARHLPVGEDRSHYLTVTGAILSQVPNFGSHSLFKNLTNDVKHEFHEWR